MKFVIQIHSAPYQNQGADTAYHFIRAALEAGHRIQRVFFYHEGIYNAFATITPPADERHVTRRWSDLARDHGIDLVICVSAAQRRGLLSGMTEDNHPKPEEHLAEGFRIAGLGQLAEAAIEADRLLVFGG